MTHDQRPNEGSPLESEIITSIDSYIRARRLESQSTSEKLTIIKMLEDTAAHLRKQIQTPTSNLNN